MRRPFMAVLALAAAAVPFAFGAAAADASGPAVPAGAGGTIASSLPPGQQPRGLRPNPALCPSGADQCLDNIVARMQRTYDADGCSHNALFARLYLDTTLQMRDAVRNHEFSNQPFWNRITDTFGTYYLDSYKNWTEGHTSRVPKAWQIAFDDAANESVSALGDFLLGINAHVNRDLALLYYQTGADDYDDHLHVNEVLMRAAGVAYPSIAAHLDPTIVEQASAAGLLSPETTPDSLNIFKWRETAWQNAEALRLAPDAAARAEIVAGIEQNALDHAREIEEAFPATPGSNADRDAYCATYR